MYSQSLTVTKQLPELEASLEKPNKVRIQDKLNQAKIDFSHLKFELSSTIAASGT